MTSGASLYVKWPPSLGKPSPNLKFYIIYYFTGVSCTNQTWALIHKTQKFCELLEFVPLSFALCNFFTRKQVVLNWMNYYLKFVDETILLWILLCRDIFWILVSKPWNTASRDQYLQSYETEMAFGVLRSSCVSGSSGGHFTGLMVALHAFLLPRINLYNYHGIVFT